MTDVAVLSETMRQGEATRAALGVQLRSRPLWNGAGRLGGAPIRFINPYRIRPVNSPELLFENIVHNGTVYMADGQVNSGNATVYTSTDLKNWVARVMATGETLVNGKLVAAGSLLVGVTQYSSNQMVRSSVDNGVTWVAQANIGWYSPMCAAGGILYLMSSGQTTDFRTMTAASPVLANRAFASARTWEKVLHNGNRWLALATGYNVAEWSANGLTGWATVPGFAAAMDAMPIGTRYAFSLGGRFIVITLASGTLSTAFSDNATTWLSGVMGDAEPTGLRATALGETAAEVDGVLYVPVKLTDGTSSWSAFIATDGIRVKWLPSFWQGGEALPGICAKAGGGGLIFNAARTGVLAAQRFENNPDALEVYLAV